jgi:hypothetical protein
MWRPNTFGAHGFSAHLHSFGAKIPFKSLEKLSKAPVRRIPVHFYRLA